VNRTTEARVAPLRIIDALTLGFNLAVGSLAALGVAFALDLLYWVGPRLVLGDAWRSLATSQLQSLPVDAGALGPLTDNIAAASQLNLLQILSGALGVGGTWPLALPSLLAGAPDLPTLGPTLALPSVWAALLIMPLLFVLGCLLGGLYLTLVAARARQDRVLNSALARWALATSGRLALLNALILVLVLSLSVPVAVGLLLANMIHPTLGVMAGALLLVVAVWVWLHGLFTVPALVLDRVNPVLAYWRSLQLVRRNFWSAIGLFGLTFILNLGLGELWRWLGETPYAVPLGMLGNAFVGTALTAALLAFYLDRRKSPMR
jgi:hypothetical protein